MAIVAAAKKGEDMKHQTFFTTLALLSALTIPSRTSAQDAQQEAKPRHHKYRLIDLGTFGGPQGFINPSGNGAPYINNRGDAVGTTQTAVSLSPNSNGFLCVPGPNVNHALLRESRQISDIGALSPSDQNCSNALGINDKGEIAGQSENGVIDPLLGLIEVRAVVWKDGKIIDLGTFGGNHSAAGSINSQGQVAGFALNAIPDPYSIYGFFFLGSTNSTQTRGFLWQNGKKRDLGTLGGPDTFAVFVNAKGQVSGGSNTNWIPNPTTGLATVDPFLWENGRMIDIGTLGGSFGFPLAPPNNRGQLTGFSDLFGDVASHPFFWDRATLTDLGTLGGTNGAGNYLNDAGEVVGQADLDGDEAHHAFLWKNGKMKDLGVLPGDTCSSAFAINSLSQIVGISSPDCDFFITAVLWEDGDLVDLNDLVSPKSDVILLEPNVITDQGVIGVNGIPPGCHNSDICGHPYLMVPIGDCDKDNEARIAARQSREATAIVGGSGWHHTIGGKTPVSPIDRLRNLLSRSLRLSGRQLQPD
jgi:probable HAF family extracellular repeat protein